MKVLTDSDRKYVVQTLATMLMTHVSHPSLKCCGIVAKALIEKFDFLKDGEGDGDVSQMSNDKLSLFFFFILALLEMVCLLSVSKCQPAWQSKN